MGFASLLIANPNLSPTHPSVTGDEVVTAFYQRRLDEARQVLASAGFERLSGLPGAPAYSETSSVVVTSTSGNFSNVGSAQQYTIASDYFTFTGAGLDSGLVLHVSWVARRTGAQSTSSASNQGAYILNAAVRIGTGLNSSGLIGEISSTQNTSVATTEVEATHTMFAAASSEHLSFGMGAPHSTNASTNWSQLFAYAERLRDSSDQVIVDPTRAGCIWFLKSSSGLVGFTNTALGALDQASYGTNTPSPVAHPMVFGAAVGSPSVTYSEGGNDYVPLFSPLGWARGRAYVKHIVFAPLSVVPTGPVQVPDPMAGVPTTYRYIPQGGDAANATAWGGSIGFAPMVKWD